MALSSVFWHPMMTSNDPYQFIRNLPTQGVTMYRRDFTAVADLIKEQLDSHDPAFDQAARDSIARIARSMADLFMCRNQRFDRQRLDRKSVV